MILASNFVPCKRSDRGQRRGSQRLTRLAVSCESQQQIQRTAQAVVARLSAFADQQTEPNNA